MGGLQLSLETGVRSSMLILQVRICSIVILQKESGQRTAFAFGLSASALNVDCDTSHISKQEFFFLNLKIFIALLLEIPVLNTFAERFLNPVFFLRRN